MCVDVIFSYMHAKFYDGRSYTLATKYQNMKSIQKAQNAVHQLGRGHQAAATLVECGQPIGLQFAHILISMLSKL